MALFLFTKSILEGQPINVFNHGLMRRDFTYVGDIVEGIVRVLDKAPQPNAAWSGDHPDPGSSSAPYRIYNLGNHQPIQLIKFIEVLEDCIGKKALKNMLPMQPGDVLETYADMEDLQREFDWQPNTSVEVGIQKFVDWYRDYYQC
jgi:UDP-glucuronate 4-epimerase